MIKLFLPNQEVPDWLQKVTVNGIEDNKAVKFTNMTAVYIKQKSYHIRSIIGPSFGASVLYIPEHYSGSSIKIEGQKPYEDSGDVILNCKPILSYMELLGAALFGISFYLYLV